MRSVAPNTNNPLRIRPKHVKLSPCFIEISLQHKTNSLDANVAHQGVLQQVFPSLCQWPCLLLPPSLVLLRTLILAFQYRLCPCPSHPQYQSLGPLIWWLRVELLPSQRHVGTGSHGTHSLVGSGGCSIYSGMCRCRGTLVPCDGDLCCSPRLGLPALGCYLPPCG